MMLRRHSSQWSLLISLALLPSFTFARGGSGRGSGEFDVGGFVGEFVGGFGGDISDAFSGLSLDPMDAAHFAFCVIFAVVTGLQALQALTNIRRRVNRNPASIAIAEYSVGWIFPIDLFISTLLLTTAYILHAVNWGRTRNLQDPDVPNFTLAFFGAWNAMDYLTDIFLVSAILALLSHREKILLNRPREILDIKRIADAILIVILLALSMADVGLIGVPDASVETAAENIYLAYIVLLLVAILDITVFSIILYIRSRGSPVNDHFVHSFLPFAILSSQTLDFYRSVSALHPLFLLYLLFMGFSQSHWMELSRRVSFLISSPMINGNLQGSSLAALRRPSLSKPA